MLHKKSIIVMMIGFLLIAGGLLVTASSVVDQKASLAGTVTSDGLVKAGQSVHEGDVLVKIDTITGAISASRATTNGIVKEVLISPGAKIAAGDIVARIEVGK
jgi:biotin carboxyl carrier protein